MSMKRQDSPVRNKIDYLIAPLITGVILLGVLISLHFAPFGDKSLAAMDANIRYLEFFAYLKDVLTGDNSIFYTFNETRKIDEELGWKLERKISGDEVYEKLMRLMIENYRRSKK